MSFMLHPVVGSPILLNFVEFVRRRTVQTRSRNANVHSSLIIFKLFFYLSVRTPGIDNTLIRLLIVSACRVWSGAVSDNQQLVNVVCVQQGCSFPRLSIFQVWPYYIVCDDLFLLWEPLTVWHQYYLFVVSSNYTRSVCCYILSLSLLVMYIGDFFMVYTLLISDMFPSTF